MRMHASSFYPAITTHVQDAVDQHGEFLHLDAFLTCLSDCQTKIQEAIEAADSPPADANVGYRIHQAAAVCLKVLTGFSMAPRNARPPAALSAPTPPTKQPPIPPTPAA